jgi:hypothetical protein
VRTKNGLKSIPISLKDGGGNFVKGQTITESELREVLKKKGDRLGGESKPYHPMVYVAVDSGDRMKNVALSDQVAKEFGLTNGRVIDQSLFADVKKREQEFSLTGQGNKPLATTTRVVENDFWSFGRSKQSEAQNEKDFTALKRKLKSLPEEKRDQHLIQWVESRSSLPSGKKEHGMTSEEKMLTVKVGKLNLHYSADDPKMVEAAAMTIKSTAMTKIPVGLSKHTTDIYLSTQKNKEDEYWEKVYAGRLFTGGKGFVSLATGGDGVIVAYNKSALRSSDIAHEMGHNLARSIYGSSTPDKNSKFALITKQKKGTTKAKIEEPPSLYGRMNKAEDFAESVAFYVTSPTSFQKSHPQRYNIINNAIKKGTE